MDNYENDIRGAEVIYSEEKAPPYNPLNRPRINYKKMIIAVLIYVVVLIPSALLAQQYFEFGGLYLFALWSLFYFIIIGKRAAIWMIHLYQNKASDETRLKCLFEPSCSEYMILAINKYGLIVGIIKGIHRLFRCHPPNGGIDYP